MTELSMTLVSVVTTCTGLVPNDPWGVDHVVGILSISFSSTD
jgi:hypothetical protein